MKSTPPATHSVHSESSAPAAVSAPRRGDGGSAARPGGAPNADIASSNELTLRGVTVSYGTTVAVDAVDLGIAPGEVVALLGPSGSGKSSLLRAVAGLEPVATGDIAWQGVSIVRTAVHRRGFGLMFQDGQLFPHRDVAGNVAYGLAHLPRAERSARVAEALEVVGMSDFARRAVTSLSGGQAQRVALARALAPKPRLLLLDEPLSALDRSLREHLSIEIRHILQETAMTCIYVTHDQDEAFAVADRIGVMIDGRVEAYAPPAQLWANPGTCSVAEFLGQGPCVPAGDGRVRALVPGAVSVIESAGQDGSGMLLEGTVVRARGARGHMTLEIDVDSTAHAGRGIASLVRAQVPLSQKTAEQWEGMRVSLSVDLEKCPVVADA